MTVGEMRKLTAHLHEDTEIVGAVDTNRYTQAFDLVPMENGTKRIRLTKDGAVFPSTDKRAKRQAVMLLLMRSDRR